MPGPLGTKWLQYKLAAPFRKLERGYHEPGLLAGFVAQIHFFPRVGAQLNTLLSRDSSFLIISPFFYF